MIGHDLNAAPRPTLAEVALRAIIAAGSPAPSALWRLRIARDLWDDAVATSTPYVAPRRDHDGERLVHGYYAIVDDAMPSWTARLEAREGLR